VCQSRGHGLARLPSIRQITVPLTASAAQQIPTIATGASQVLTAFAASTRVRCPLCASTFLSVRPVHSPPTCPPASIAARNAPGIEAISPAASAPAAPGES
jgi:hypothetical protein